MRIIQYHKRGMTLIEVVLSLAIIGLTAGIVTPMVAAGIKSYALVAHRRSALAEAKLTLNRMIGEFIRIPNTNSITKWSPANIAFDTQSESNISYSLAGTDIIRNGVIIANSASMLNFTYLNAAGNPAAVKADIKSIRVELAIDAGAEHGLIRLRTEVFPRGFSRAYGGFN